MFRFLTGFAIVFMAIFVVVAWPYLPGAFLAVQLGASNPSTARSVVGWFFEILSIAGVMVQVVAARDRLIPPRGAATPSASLR